MTRIKRIFTDLFSTCSVSLREGIFATKTLKHKLYNKFLLHYSSFNIRYSLFIICLVLSVNYSFSQNKTIDSLRTAIFHAKEDTNKVNLLSALAGKLQDSNPDTAILLCNQALIVAEKIRWKKGIAKSLRNLGWFNYLSGKYPLALNYYIRALNIYRVTNDKSGISASLGNIGIAYNSQGDFPRALEHLFKALVIANELGNKSHISAWLSSIGNVYSEQRDYSKALEHNFKALEIDREMGNKRGIAISLGNIGNVYMNRGDYTRALEHYFKALEIDKEFGSKSGIARHMGNIGIVYESQGNYPKALEHYFKALELAQELGNKNHIADIHGNIGILYYSQKRFAEAEEYLQQAIGLSVSIGTLNNLMDFENLLANLYSEAPVNATVAGKKRGTQNGVYTLAIEHYQKYLQAKETLFSEEKSESMGKLEARHEFALIEMEMARKQKEEQAAEASAVKRRDKIQFTGLVATLIVVVLIVLLILFSKFNIAPRIKMGSLFIALVLLFEFMLVWFDPAIEKYTGGNPAYKLFINALLALGFYFVQQTIVKLLPLTVKSSTIRINTIGLLIICAYSFVHLCGFSFVPFVVKEENLNTKNTKNFTKDAKIDSLKLLLSQYEIQSAALHSKNKMKEAFETLKKYGDVKDTLQKLEQSQEEAKVIELNAMELQKKKQEQEAEEKEKIEKEKKERKNLLIYSIILIGIIFLFITFSVSGRLRQGNFEVPSRVLEGGLFVSFLLFFEFILVFADPYVEQFTSGAPAWKFCFNVMIAALIFPVHGWLEGKIKGRLMKNPENYTSYV